jgi:imidazoleglycerol-phosphate dehydratase / histidinol-phosphatase
MKKVFVDRDFFSLQNKNSEGLISGLKKLAEYSFEIFSAEIDSIDPVLINILKLEKISLKKNKNDKPEYDFRIIAKGKSSESSIVVGKENIKSFYDAANKIIAQKRIAVIKRRTKETDIEINVNLDGGGKSKIKTGIGFFDHMLDQIARHANLDLFIKVKGDLEVDEHHTIEDTGIALGEAIKNALGSKKGIKRYGYFIPMDESVAVCAIDLSGRHYLNYSCKFSREYVGELPTEMVKEFFRGISAGMTANLYISAKGENDHHKIEAMFKSFAKALNEACRIDERAGNSLPTTKGLL